MTDQKRHTGGMLPRRLQPAFGRVKAEFEKGEAMTKHDVANRCHMVARNAEEYIKLLRSDGDIYIKEWVRLAKSGEWSPAWAWGKEQDAKKPERTTESVRRERWRNKDGNSEREAAKKRAKRLAAKLGLSVVACHVHVAT